MESYFNELSFLGSDEISGVRAYDTYKKFLAVLHELKESGVGKCRISGDYYTQMFCELNQMGQSAKNMRDALPSFLCFPFESEEVEEKSDDYLEARWTYGGKDCYGLALAYIMDSIAVSMGDSIWAKPFLTIMRCEEANGALPVKVRNAYEIKNLECHREHISDKQEVHLRCVDPGVKKYIKLADDHHGNQILKAFAKKLNHCPYVEGCVNSLEQNSYKKDFIAKVCKDGMIYVTLYWTERGLGMAIQTTGRNIRETEEIAKILEKTYGRK